MPYVIMIDNGRQYSDHWHFPAAVAESETMARAVVTGFQRWVSRYHALHGEEDWDWGAVEEYMKRWPAPIAECQSRKATLKVDAEMLLMNRDLTAWYVKVPEV